MRNIRPQTFECLAFFLGSSARLQARPLDGFRHPIRHTTRFCARKCLLGLENLNVIFNLFIRQIPKKLQWRLWGKFNIFSNCHNFCRIQDRVVIFVSTYGFLERPIQRCHLNLPPTDPCCHRNEIWDKIGYNSAYMRDISEILASNRGFSGPGYLMMSAKFYSDQPWLPLPWQPNLGQNW